jgi:hypothetical protein
MELPKSRMTEQLISAAIEQNRKNPLGSSMKRFTKIMDLTRVVPMN